MIKVEKVKEIAFWVLILVTFILILSVIYYLYSDAGKCIQSPLVYGVKKYNNNINDFYCVCSTPTSNRPIFITKEGIVRYGEE